MPGGRFFIASGGASGSRMDRKCKSGTVSVWLEWVFILSPSARTGPSRLGPAGEGRSDGGVLHLHPQGQARYPEGGRRREDEPQGRVARSRRCRETASTRATSAQYLIRRAISVQLTPATSGLSRSLADTPTRRSGHVERRSRTDSQADSARTGQGWTGSTHSRDQRLRLPFKQSG
jgi:hypothetical protein